MPVEYPVENPRGELLHHLTIGVHLSLDLVELLTQGVAILAQFIDLAGEGISDGFRQWSRPQHNPYGQGQEHGYQ